MFKILLTIKNIFVHIRSSLKLIFLIIISATIIIGIISVFYRPTYAVSLNGEILGYTTNKTELQQKINQYMMQGEDGNVAFIDIEDLPEYALCLRKRNAETTDEEILSHIKNSGEKYYSYYAIVEGEEEKYYVSTKEEAEQVIEMLKSKKSSNINKIAYTEVFGKDLKEFTETDSIVTALYKKPTTIYNSYSSYKIAYEKVNLGISLIKPISYGYTITSRFGSRWGTTHTGLDVAAPMGTNIVAAAAGTVTRSTAQVDSAGNYSGYGEYIVISHGNGIQTLYGHCSARYVSEGQYVEQGQLIGAVGSTGKSTGPHLHLEIRINGAVADPQNYLY